MGIDNQKQSVVPVIKQVLMKHKERIIFGCVALVAAVYFLVPASMSTLQEQLLSDDRVVQKNALDELKNRGEEAIPYLMYGLNHPKSRVRNQIVKHIRKYPGSASFYLTDVVEDPSSIYNHQAKLSAVRALGSMRGDVESLLQRLVANSSTHEDLKQEAMGSLVKLKPRIYEKIYFYMDGRWSRANELMKQGYIRIEDGWVSVQSKFFAVEKNLNEAAAARDNLKTAQEQIIRDIQNNHTIEFDRYLADWQAMFAMYEGANTTFVSLLKSLTIRSKKAEKTYSNMMKEHLEELHSETTSFVDRLTELNQEGLVTRVLEKQTRHFSAVSKFVLFQYIKWNDFDAQMARCKKNYYELSRKNTLFMYLDYKFFGISRDKAQQNKIAHSIENIIRETNIYYKISSQTPQRDSARHWLNCRYREVDMGSYDKDRPYVRRVRVLCHFSYWVNGNEVLNWERVISSSHQLSLPKEREIDDDQKAILHVARKDFQQKLEKWTPESFSLETLAVKKAPRIKMYGQSSVDVVYMKNGRKLKGLIAKENSKGLDLIMLSSKAGITSSLKIKIAKRKVKKIKRLAKDIRRLRLQDIRTSEKPLIVDEQKSNAINVEKTNSEYSRACLLYPSKYFMLYSDTPQEFVPQIAFRIEVAFAAYQQYFPIKRNTNKKIDIHVFTSTTKYQKITKETVNDAVYNRVKNHIIARCNLDNYRKYLKDSKKDNKDAKDEIKKHNEALAELNKELSSKRATFKQLDKQLARGKISQRDYNDAYRNTRIEIDRLNSQIKKIERLKAKLGGKLTSDRSSSRDRLDFIESMMRMIYREMFIAYTKNYLFTEEKVVYTPRWFLEGFAQYFEDLYLSGERVILGKRDKDRTNYFNQVAGRDELSLQKLLAAGDNDFVVTSRENIKSSDTYYIQSWGVAYYITTLTNMKRNDIFTPYIDNIWRGKDQEQAFTELVGIPMTKFRRKLFEFYRD
ncbi:DUF1570 domain-containing protein [Candidatus Uabimicrobium amorphum]|uniref:DUF1570 domain-containing protein n=1 Tax=Uabimicrobium amorphum TaxID=2596890 RepID=A0A5S9IRJ1_UABAM|nr:DUF1570 domain-containing protein [Candidatus Uabimicrobium amorphum]BBM86808.1 hypothetical protein UABAM_05196 [Candidatus Uabimicrobium amorphum]